MSGLGENFELSRYDFSGYQLVILRAGNRGLRRVVPPAGEAHAFDVPDWARRIEVSVSPTGRSVRVFVDGQEVPVPAVAAGEQAPPGGAT